MSQQMFTSPEEQKEQSVMPEDSVNDLIDVTGRIRFFEHNSMLVVQCRFQSQDGSFYLRQRIELEVADNIFDQIYLIYDTAEIFGLNFWQTMRINYLSIDDYHNASILRLTLLTYFCEELNGIQIVL